MAGGSKHRGGVSLSWLDDFVAATECPKEDRVLEMLWSRGVTDEQIALFRIGYLNRDLPALDYPRDFLEWSQGGRKLDDMCVLPLTNALGTIKGIQFRHVDRDRKGYTDFIVDKGEAVLFGLGQAMTHVWRTGKVYLVEGGFDLFPIQRIFPGVVATLTAGVSPPLWRVLWRLCWKIWMGYDMDRAGQEASFAFAKQHGRELKVSIMSYPKVPMLGPKPRLTKDPGELWEAWGEARFQAHLKSILFNGLE